MLLPAGSALAEPTSTVRWLMNEPFTVWDWGMHRLDEKLEGHFGHLEGITLGHTRNPLITHGSVISATVTYWMKQNRLMIIVTSNTDTIMNSQEGFLKGVCANLVSETKRASFVGEDGSSRLYGNESSLLVLLFSHEGFSSRGRPVNLGSDLDAITEIRVVVDDFETDESIGRQSMLPDSRVLYTENVSGSSRSLTHVPLLGES